MTQQNKAREALELLSKIQGLLILSNSVRTGQSIGDTHDVDELFSPIRSILERLEGVDRVALREAIERHNRFCNDENTTASDIYLDGQMGADNELFRQAARIIADMGE